MKRQTLDIFFQSLADKISDPLQIYITGGIAAWLMGGNRPTQDIDFALKGAKDWEKISNILYDCATDHQIALEFAEDISRWGMVGFSNFTQNAKLYKRFGSIQVFTLEPSIWAIGKISRYLEDDIKDIQVVFKKQKVKIEKALETWAQALLQSPKSSEQTLFIRKVNDFLKYSGPKIWGSKFNFERHRDYFQKLLKSPKNHS